MKKSFSTRREFIRNSSLGLTAAGLGATHPSSGPDAATAPCRLPREVWVGTVASGGLRAETAGEMVSKVIEIMEKMAPFQPDIICLPEVFAYTGINEKFEIREVAAAVPGPVVSPLQDFARRHQCYVICPTYIRQQHHYYIGAVLIDRGGKVAGEYLKSRPADSELAAGVMPGPLDPPVFTTDFGKIGIQICYDIKWDEGWHKLKAAGAEIIFWPSAYAGGRELSGRAWRHQVYIVSSTLKDSSRICDMTGEVIAQTGRWQSQWVCAPLNLEKAFLHAWPAVRVFPEIQKKYGRKIKLTTYTEEEWTTLESLDPEVKIADVLAEFDLPTHYQHINNSSRMQNNKR